MAQFHDSDWWSKELKRMLDEQRPEDLHLDYKDKRSLLPRNRGGGIDKQQRANDVSKDVSSFLNSDGGVLIYGVSETDDPNATGGTPTPPIPVDSCGPDKIGFERGEIDKETIENLITSNIQPKPGPDFFQIVEVEHEGRIVFVVEIAVGIGDVWQAKDKKYYRRFHYKAEAMEHYEISMVRSRGVVPNLKLVFGWTDTWAKQMTTQERVKGCTIYVGVQNTATTVVEAALFELWLCEFNNIHPAALRPFLPNGHRTVRMSGKDFDAVRYELNWPIDGSYRPIFRTEDPTYISHVGFDIDTRHADRPDQTYPTGRSLFWRIQSPNMVAKSGKVEVVMKRLPLAGGAEISLEEYDGDFEILSEA